MTDKFTVISYPLIAACLESLPRVMIPEGKTDAGGITIKYYALAMTPDVDILMKSSPVPF
jgi:hypothetical protein